MRTSFTAPRATATHQHDDDQHVPHGTSRSGLGSVGSTRTSFTGRARRRRISTMTVVTKAPTADAATTR
jgi:hypothetical protein